MSRQSVLIFASLLLLISIAEALPSHILERRDNFNELVSELRSKGSRMRFGKRSPIPINTNDPTAWDYFLSVPPLATNAFQ